MRKSELIILSFARCSINSFSPIIVALLDIFLFSAGRMDKVANRFTGGSGRPFILQIVPLLFFDGERRSETLRKKRFAFYLSYSLQTSIRYDIHLLSNITLVVVPSGTRIYSSVSPFTQKGFVGNQLIWRNWVGKKRLTLRSGGMTPLYVSAICSVSYKRGWRKETIWHDKRLPQR